MAPVKPARKEDSGVAEAPQSPRSLAAGLLLVAAGLFLVARFFPDQPTFGWELLEAAAEAALVGGLADWFAVTALFRHPLGLPIPHTALIPHNQSRIARAAGRFVADHFLEPEHLQQRLGQYQPVVRIGHWLARPENAAFLAPRLLAAVPAVLESLEDRQIRVLLRRLATSQARRLPLSVLLGKTLQAVLEGGQHRPLLDRLLVELQTLLKTQHQDLATLVAARSRWYVPRFLDRRLVSEISAGLEGLLDDLTQPEHDTRRRLEAGLAELAERLQGDPTLDALIEGWKSRLLAMPEAQAFFHSLWDRLRCHLQADLRQPEPVSRRSLEALIRRLGQTLSEDNRLRQRLETGLDGLLLTGLSPWREEIGHHVTQVIESWPREQVSRRLEAMVGRDLQYIRLNGTLVGALIGMALYLLSAGADAAFH